MKKIFCINCGKKFEFQLAAPKFCSGCGTNLETGEAAKASEPTKAHPQSSGRASVVNKDGEEIEFYNSKEDPDVSLADIERLKANKAALGSVKANFENSEDIGSIETLRPPKNNNG